MPAITHYDQGDVWTPQATFKVSGVATDPTTVTVRVKKPDGTVTVAGPVAGGTGGSGIVRASAGVYTFPVTLDNAGYWFARFEGTGAATGAEDQQAIVDPSEFYESAQLGGLALVGLAETKDWLQQQNINTTNDLELARVINDVSDLFQSEAGREIKSTSTVAAPETRTFEAPLGGQRDVWYIDGDYMGDRATWRRTLRVGDLTSFTQVQIYDTDWTTVLETVSPLTKISSLPTPRKSWEPIRALQFNSTVTALGEGMRVAVTGVWGFPTVPGKVRQAVLDEIALVMDRDVEHYRQDNASPPPSDGGNVVVIGNNTGRLLALSPRAQAVAWSLREISVA